jgi:hypothetical protein
MISHPSGHPPDTTCLHNMPKNVSSYIKLLDFLQQRMRGWYGRRHDHTLAEGYVLEGACHAQRGALKRLHRDDGTPVRAGADHPAAVTPGRSTVGLDATVAFIDLERASVYHTIYYSVDDNQGIGWFSESTPPPSEKVSTPCIFHVYKNAPVV